MTRKHNTKHRRGRSRYPERLASRGETSASVRMRYISDDSHERRFGKTSVELALDIPEIDPEWVDLGR